MFQIVPHSKIRGIPRFVDFTGRRFGILVAEWPEAIVGKGKDRQPTWLCLCDCGVLTHKWSSALTQYGGARGCRTHRFQPGWGSYVSAKQRATNPRHPQWKDYGGRGIEFRFSSFSQFIVDIGKKPSAQHTLDRINNDGHYEPGNIRWATHLEQIQNRRTKQKVTRKRNPIKAASYRTKYRSLHPDRVRKSSQLWAERHPEKVKERIKKQTENRRSQKKRNQP